MNLQNLFKERTKYEKLNKKIKNEIKKDDKQITITVLVSYIFSLTITTTTFNYLINDVLIIIALGFVSSLILFLFFIPLFSLYSKIRYSKHNKFKLFSFYNKKRIKMIEKNKDKLNILIKNQYKDLFLQNLISIIKNSNKEEIIDSANDIKEYILNKKDFELEKKEIEELLEKKLHGKRKESDRLSELLKIKKEEEINIIKSL